MSLPLENTIMSRIGFGSNLGYNWYNGSGSCGGIRRRAAEQLREAINEARAAGEQIAELDGGCEAIVKHIAAFGDERDTTLTKTWQAAANCIRMHMEAAAGSATAIQSFVDDYKQKIDGRIVEGRDGVKWIQSERQHADGSFSCTMIPLVADEASVEDHYPSEDSADSYGVRL